MSQQAQAIVMAWSECEIEIGAIGSNDAMGASLASIGTIKDRSSFLESSDGDSLEMKSTGGHTVDKEFGEGGFALRTRVIEPDGTLEAALGLTTTAASQGEVTIKTHLVDGYKSVKVTPKNVGAWGIKAPKCKITYKPGWSEEDGNYADLSIEILHGAAGYWYSKFQKAAPVSQP